MFFPRPRRICAVVAFITVRPEPFICSSCSPSDRSIPSPRFSSSQRRSSHPYSMTLARTVNLSLFFSSESRPISHSVCHDISDSVRLFPPRQLERTSSAAEASAPAHVRNLSKGRYGTAPSCVMLISPQCPFFAYAVVDPLTPTQLNYDRGAENSRTGRLIYRCRVSPI